MREEDVQEAASADELHAAPSAEAAAAADEPEPVEAADGAVFVTRVAAAAQPDEAIMIQFNELIKQLQAKRAAAQHATLEAMRIALLDAMRSRQPKYHAHFPNKKRPKRARGPSGNSTAPDGERAAGNADNVAVGKPSQPWSPQTKRVRTAPSGFPAAKDDEAALRDVANLINNLEQARGRTQAHAAVEALRQHQAPSLVPAVQSQRLMEQRLQLLQQEQQQQQARQQVPLVGGSLMRPPPLWGSILTRQQQMFLPYSMHGNAAAAAALQQHVHDAQLQSMLGMQAVLAAPVAVVPAAPPSAQTNELLPLV